MRQHRVVHTIWGCIALAGVVLYLIFMGVGPPAFVERHWQRTKVVERVQAAGGWDAIRLGCISLAQQNTNGLFWFWVRTNELPPVVIALKPMIINYSPQLACVSIQIFGMHRTGGHSSPYFGLEVYTATNSMNYNPSIGFNTDRVIGSGHSGRERVAEGIYEVY